jgi:DNA mismatch repair protein MSH4
MFGLSKILMPMTSMNSTLVNFVTSQFPSIEVKYLERKFFSESTGESLLKELVCVADRPSMDVLVSQKYLCLSSAACLFHYLNEEHDVAFLPLSLHIDFQTCDGFLMLDPMTIRCMELLEPNRIPTIGINTRPVGKSIKSLFDVVNFTQTSQGARLLKFNLLQAPSDLNTIRFRQSCIKEILSSEELYFSISKALLAFGDVDPILAHLIRSSSQKASSQRTISLINNEQMKPKVVNKSRPSPSKHQGHSTRNPVKDSVKNKLSQAQNRVSTLLRLKRTLNGLPTLRGLIASSSHPFFVALQKTLSDPDLTAIGDLLNDMMADTNATANATVQFRNAIQRRDIIYALKDGVNGLLDAARRVYIERLQDIQNIIEEYKTEFPQFGLQEAHNSTRGYFLRISDSSMSTSKSAPMHDFCMRTDLRSLDATQEEIDEGDHPSMPFLPRASASHEIKDHTTISSTPQLPEMFILRAKVGRRIEFTTEDLVALNGRVQEAVNEIMLLTSQLLEEAQKEICERIGCLYKFGESIALLDLMFSFATYVTLCPEPCCCPEIVESGPNGHIQVIQGYHPILLAQSGAAESNSNSNRTTPSPSSALAAQTHKAIPNNIKSSKNGFYMQLITGRNNSGKTTYLLQTATLTLLAHMGCYIPAAFASFSLVDRILTRISSHDKLIASSNPMASSSAFFNEMSETAYILDSCTTHSLVLLDELGKSTSCDDGMPICFAICENLMQRKIQSFFATHFLDMASKLEDLYAMVLVQKMAVDIGLDATSGRQKSEARYALVKGCEEDSGYGIHLASDAGWPTDVIDYAHQLRSKMIELHGGRDQISLEYSRRAKMNRLKRTVLEQLRFAKSAKIDSLNLHVFLHKLAVRYRERMNEVIGEPTRISAMDATE